MHANVMSPIPVLVIFHKPDQPCGGCYCELPRVSKSREKPNQAAAEEEHFEVKVSYLKVGKVGDSPSK